MKRSFLPPLALSTALALGLIGGVSAAQYTTLDTEASRISFGYSQMGVGMEGNFSEVQATRFSFDPADPEAAQVAIEIPLSSIDAGYDDANTELVKSEWLNLADHPRAQFESSTVEALGDNRFQVTGELSIKGQAKEVTAPFTFKEEDDTGIFEGSFTFQRGDFAIGEGSWSDSSIVAGDIQINFQFVAR